MRHGRGDLVRTAGIEAILEDDLEDGDPEAAARLTDDLEAMGPTFVKLGQLLSTRVDLISPAYVEALSRLQDDVEPFEFAEVERLVSTELGVRLATIFPTFDPTPLAAASLGQVHRATLRDGREVVVKVQRPDIREQVFEDMEVLREVAALIDGHSDLGQRFGIGDLLEEFRRSLIEELDYRREAANQRHMAAYYEGHPTIHVPRIIDELSTRRVVTSELSVGARFSELAGWSQAERDLAAETIYRFVFRSLYEIHAFNGDPHPGNYLFHGDGRVTFLDFGLVKHFTATELQPLVHMVRDLCVDNDPEGFRSSMEKAGFLAPNAPLSTETIIEHMAVFYETVRRPGPLTITEDYASAVVRRFFDLRSPVAAYASIPRSYVILQRINLGMFALLGQLHATADWRGIAEEIWPFVLGPPSTPMGHAEAAWLASRPDARAAPSIRQA